MTTVTGFCHEYKLLEKALESVKANRDQIGKHINRIIQFLHDEPSLQSKNTFHLVMTYNIFNMLLKLICYCFVEDVA